MKLYNTLTRKKEDFVTLEPNKVKMYVCGPTVYNYIHIGNARPFVIFDAVRRYLEYKGYEVNFVQNFTDVDDKIINRANEENSDMQTVSNKYIEEFFKDSEGLNIKKAVAHPRVTDEIPEIIEMIKTLIEKGYAYEVDGTVYFETESFAEYGKLSGKNTDDLQSGARVAVEEKKRSPADFVLWKPAKPKEPKWQSPWGEGRPGWHIECSVMAKKYLGDTIDIHAGGEDLIFPHHENEVAQSECANGKPFAKYWLHNGMINVDNKKMSKSTGNFFTVRDIVAKYHYDVIRFFILSGHYRMPLNFSDELLKAAENALGRIRNCCSELKFIIEKSAITDLTEEESTLLPKADSFRLSFEESMDDDFNTANAVTAIFEFVSFANSCKSGGNTSKAFAKILFDGIQSLCDIMGIKTEASMDKIDVSEIEELIAKRDIARKEKNWALSDQIRDELKAKGISIKDTSDGVKWSIL